jgi:uncharacterized protein YxjI
LRYRLTAASSFRTQRYLVADEASASFCEFTGGSLLKISDSTGAELASLRRVDDYYFQKPRYELLRGEISLGTIERAFRKFTIIPAGGGKMVIARDWLKTKRQCARDGSIVGHVARRRFQGKRTYEVDLAEDIDPLPILCAVVAIDQCRRFKWHDIFAPSF